MPALEAIIAAVILVRYAIGRPDAIGPALAVFLAFQTLVAAGPWPRPGTARQAAPRSAVWLVLAAAKLALCATAYRAEPACVLAWPAVIMGAPLRGPLAAPADDGWRPVPWVVAAALAAAPSPLIEVGQTPVYLGVWAVACAWAADSAVRSIRERRLRSRVGSLERELASSQERLDGLRRVGAEAERLAAISERERLARSLHDELGHTLTGGIMQLDAARLLFDDEPERARRIVDRVSATLKDGLSSIRLSLRAMKPEAEAIGAQRLRAALEDFRSRHGLETRLSLDGPLEAMPAEQWRVAADNLTEAMTNTLRHGRASLFSCSVTALNRLYKVEFKDDGSTGAVVRQGMGLEGMETRTREAGGTMLVDSSRGFSVIMLFPRGGTNDGDTATDRR
ncbi:MAG TPA: histidine kinase [Spirochaetales bacterium]|nr:histidine kinase [Spirochaetales bacterium]